MFIETVPNRGSLAVLLRESYRDENGWPQKRTLANLSKLSEDVVALLKATPSAAATWPCGSERSISNSSDRNRIDFASCTRLLNARLLLRSPVLITTSTSD